MRTNTIYKTLLICFFSYFIQGCASTTAPAGWLSTPIEAQQESYGAWIQVESNNNSYTEGEFISVSSDSLLIFTSIGLEFINRSDIKTAQLTTFDSEYGKLSGWTTIGSLSSLSHGFVMILSLPLWIIVGTTSTASQSKQAIEKYPQKDWNELTAFARFPGGFPEGVDINKIGSKKYRIKKEGLSKRQLREQERLEKKKS